MKSGKMKMEIGQMRRLIVFDVDARSATIAIIESGFSYSFRDKLFVEFHLLFYSITKR